jgi:hypothetical protein
MSISHIQICYQLLQTHPSAHTSTPLPCATPIRGGYRFSTLVKQNKKAKNYAVFYFAGFFLKKKFCYEVIVKQFF